MIFWSLVMIGVLLERRGRGCATPTSSAPAAATVEPQQTPTVRLNRDFCNSPNCKAFEPETELILGLRRERRLGIKRLRIELIREHGLKLALDTIHKVLVRHGER